MPSSRYYSIYICIYHEQDKFIARHYTIGYSKCEKISVVEEGELEKSLNVEDFEKLKKIGELLVTDLEYIDKLLKSIGLDDNIVEEYFTNPYVYIVIYKT